MRCAAILLMGGLGERFASGLPKQFHRLAGKKIYQYPLETLLGISELCQIILVTPREWMTEVEQDMTSYQDARIAVISGGKTRQESSFLGLLACAEKTTHVVIHDAVRPFASREIFLQNIAAAVTYAAVDTCIPSHDTIVHTKDGTGVTAIPLRSEYFRGQTPQSFSYPLILKAHKEFQGANSSDDCSLVIRQGLKVYIVPGDISNIKVTTQFDLMLAEQILLRQIQTVPSKQRSLAHKRYAVIGGSSGIGKAVCELLKEEGAIALNLSRSSLEYPVDLRSFCSVQSVFERIGPIEGLINSAGLLSRKSLATLTESEIDALIQTNFSGVVYACKCAQVKSGGHILNIASSSYLQGKKNYAIYSAAKAAVVNFSQGLAEERQDLHVHAIVPQRTHTPMRRMHFPEEEILQLLSPQEIAQTLINLLKQEGYSGGVVAVRKEYHEAHSL